MFGLNRLKTHIELWDSLIEKGSIRDLYIMTLAAVSRPGKFTYVSLVCSVYSVEHASRLSYKIKKRRTKDMY